MHFSSSHPMAIAWKLIEERGDFGELAPWPHIQRDTAIAICLDHELNARHRARAAEHLADLDDSHARETCDRLLEASPSSLVRQAVISRQRGDGLLLRRLQYDPSYVVRVRALRALSESVSLDNLRLVANDPHWRVRYALLRIIEQRGCYRAIEGWNANEREIGFVHFAKWRQMRSEGRTPPDPPLPAPSSTTDLQWDSDPAVLLAQLKQQPRQEWLDQLPKLIHHDDEHVRSWAVGQMLEFGDAKICARAAALATDPRSPGWWAVDSLIARLPPKRRPEWNSITPRTKAFSAEHPMERGCVDPMNETSWPALTKHLQEQGLSPQHILPATVVTKPSTPPSTIALSATEPTRKRLAVSGHYLLPTEQFAVAFDAGISEYFWESNYGTFNRFVARLSASDLQRLRMLAGTFEAEPKKIRKDIDRALRLLRVERLEVFLLFWSRSQRRFNSETIRELDRAKDAGKIRRYGLSTHQWELARDRVEAKWDPVMVRHNLAHRRAEEIVFPAARAHGTRIISFSSTCYGRLIEAGVKPADCIRYSLAQKEIDLVLTAPATAEQLRENLAALDAPEPDDDELARWRAVGDQVYRDNIAFRDDMQSR
ncbi:MAG: aldo/keto reductase [Planctomycetota bacterium]